MEEQFNEKRVLCCCHWFAFHFFWWTRLFPGAGTGEGSESAAGQAAYVHAGSPMGGMMGPGGMAMMLGLLRDNPKLAGMMMQMRGEMMRIRGEEMSKMGDVMKRYGERLEKESSK